MLGGALVLFGGLEGELVVFGGWHWLVGARVGATLGL
jgi:hypothetical protein